MFFFKKNTAFLKDIIPENYIDIHSHLLPSIDDGSKSIEDSIKMIKELKDIGFSQFITTPHIITHVWDNTKSSIAERLDYTKNKLSNAFIDNPITAAAEYMMDGDFVKIFQTEQLLTLKENYVLVEMSYLSPPIQLYDILFQLQVAGYKPVLAHPERYSFYHSNLAEYKKLKNAGCLFQLNLLSSVGYYGPDVTKTAEYLLTNNLIDYVGSDVHHMKHVSYFYKKIVLKSQDKLELAIQNNIFFKL